MKYPETAMRLRKAMEAKDLTPQELSNKSGVSKGSISLYLSGKNEPRTRNAGKMAEVLGVTPMYLMGFNMDIVKSDENQTKRSKSIKEINAILSQVDDDTVKRLLSYALYLSQEKDGDD